MKYALLAWITGVVAVAAHVVVEIPGTPNMRVVAAIGSMSSFRLTVEFLDGVSTASEPLSSPSLGQSVSQSVSQSVLNSTCSVN